MFRDGGFSIDLTHHALHALGSRLYGFTPEVFDDSQGLDPQALEMLVRQISGRYPRVAELAQAVYHDEASSSARAATTSSNSSSHSTCSWTASIGPSGRRPPEMANLCNQPARLLTHQRDPDSWTPGGNEGLWSTGIMTSPAQSAGCPLCRNRLARQPL